MKSLIFVVMTLVFSGAFANADCTTAYQDVLYKQAKYDSTNLKVVRVGPIPLDLVQDHLNKATAYLGSYIGTENNQFRHVDVARAMLRVQDPSQVEVIILEWTGTVHRPTNKRIRGYEGILVNKNTCKNISDTFSYDNNSIGERNGLPPQGFDIRAW